MKISEFKNLKKIAVKENDWEYEKSALEAVDWWEFGEKKEIRVGSWQDIWVWWVIAGLMFWMTGKIKEKVSNYGEKKIVV